MQSSHQRTLRVDKDIVGCVGLVEGVLVLAVPVRGDHVDGLRVQHGVRVGGGQGGRGRVAHPEPGGVAAVVVRVQGPGVPNHGVGVEAGKGAAGGLRHPVHLLPGVVVVVVGADQVTHFTAGQRDSHPRLVPELSEVLVEHQVLVDPVRVLLAAGEDGLLHQTDVVVVSLRVVPHSGPHRRRLELGVGSVRDPQTSVDLGRSLLLLQLGHELSRVGPPQGAVLHLADHGPGLSSRLPPSQFPQHFSVLGGLQTVSGLDLGQPRLQPPGDVPLDHDVPDRPLPLHLDVVLEEPPLHPLLTIVPLVGETLLHVLVEVEHLVLGLLLKTLQPIVDLLIVLIKVSENVLLILLNCLPNPFQQRPTVTVIFPLASLLGPWLLAVLLLGPDVVVVRGVGGGHGGHVRDRPHVLTLSLPLPLSDGPLPLPLPLPGHLPQPHLLLLAGLQVTDDVLDVVTLQYRHYLTQFLPHGNVHGRLVLLVPHGGVRPSLHQDPRQLLPAHGGGDVQSSVSVLKWISKMTEMKRMSVTLFCSETRHLALIKILMTPACPYRAAVWKGVSPYCNVRYED